MLTTKAAALEQIGTIEELWTTARADLAAEGVDFAIYLTVDQDRASPFVLTNIPGIYELIDPGSDPFLSHCCDSYDFTRTGPAFLPDYDYLPEAAKAFIARARLTGFRTGIGIPMRLQGSARFGGFNLGTRLDIPAFEAQMMPRAEEFRFYCLLMHRRIEELSGSGQQVDPAFRDLLIAPAQPALDQLSPREREVIYLVSQGISRKECARLCGISPNTVAEYTKSAYRKLGVQNRVEAARLVMRRAV